MATTSTGSGITGLRQVALTVSEVTRSVHFYREAVGLPFLFSAGPDLAFLDIGGVRLMLSAPETGFTPGASSVLYFQVADIDAAYAAMSARGVVFVDAPHFLAPMPDHDLWLCAFRDPDGNPMALLCEKAKVP